MDSKACGTLDPAFLKVYANYRLKPQCHTVQAGSRERVAVFNSTLDYFHQ